MWKGVPSHFPFLLTFIKNTFLFLVEIMKKNDQSWREKSSDYPLISYQKRKKTRNRRRTEKEEQSHWERNNFRA